MSSFRDLKSYQSSLIIHDFTAEFVKLYIDPRSRTQDQMVQAARSGKQNIVEGTEEKTSGKTELHLLGVARASLAELLEDYTDFLRQRSMSKWDKDDPRAKAVRNLAYQNKSDGTYRSDKSYQSYMPYLKNPESAASAMISVINQCNYLLDRQIKSMEEKYAEGASWDDKMKERRVQKQKEKIMSNFWTRLS